MESATMGALLAAAILACPFQESDVEPWIARLSSDSVEARDDASRRLKAMGPPILGVLRERVARTSDKEVAARLKEVIAHLERREAMLKLLPAEYLDDGKTGVKDGLLVFLGDASNTFSREFGRFTDKTREECDKIIRENGGELTHYFRKYFHHLTGRPCLVKAGRLSVDEVSGKLSLLKETRFVWRVKDGEITAATPFFNPGFNLRKSGVGLRFSPGTTELKARAFLEMVGIAFPARYTPGHFPECYVLMPDSRNSLLTLLMLDRADEILQITPNWVER